MIFPFCGNIRRAALKGVALLFLCGSISVAAPDTKSKKAETAKDIIEKAFNLSLQKDRSQAINILVGAIRQENLRNGNASELLKALQQVSYLFYSDRAQQNYELALSLRRTEPAQSQQKLSEALRVETDNLSLFNEMQRLLIIRGDCSNAFENITKERLQDPYDEFLILLQAQANACLGKWESYVKTRDLSDYKKSNQYKFWLGLEIEYQLSQKSQVKAKELQNTLAKLDGKYPEAHYWNWRVALVANEKQTAGQKYVKECKNLPAALYRQYMIDVNLCRRVSDVETASKVTNGSTE